MYFAFQTKFDMAKVPGSSDTDCARNHLLHYPSSLGGRFRKYLFTVTDNMCVSV